MEVKERMDLVLFQVLIISPDDIYVACCTHAFTGALPLAAVRSPKQKAPRGAGPEAASRPAEQV